MGYKIFVLYWMELFIYWILSFIFHERLIFKILPTCHFDLQEAYKFIHKYNEGIDWSL